jgi:arylsulfatase A-like enzyme
MPRRNLVIFNPDHYRGEALGHLGNPCVQTPNLDRLTRTDGVSFRNAFCQNPVCTPSRCCFMTGWYPHVRGHRTMSHMLRQDEPDLLSRLKDLGYFVWWGGKNDLIPAQHGFAKYCHVRYCPEGPFPELPPDWRGPPDGDGYFSMFYGKAPWERQPGSPPDSDWACIEAALAQIRNRPADRPFCLYLPLYYPHPPLVVEEPFFSMIPRDQVPPRLPTPPDNWAGKPSMLKGIFEKSHLKNWSEEQWRELRAVYYGMCSRLDFQFGLILDALRETGVYDDTAIFFFSDHGMYIGDYGLVDINQNTFEDALTRVPLVVKPPRGVALQAGIRDALVELTDFTATVEALLDLPPTHTHFGRSLLPLIAGACREHRDAVFCEGGRLRGERHCMELEYRPGHEDPHDLYYPRLSFQAAEGPEHAKAAMCRTSRYKYVRRLAESDEFYDLERDPGEAVNRIDAPEYRETIAALKERMLTWYMETCDIVPHDLDHRVDEHR